MVVSRNVIDDVKRNGRIKRPCLQFQIECARTDELTFRDVPPRTIKLFSRDFDAKHRMASINYRA
jgi:hypothetical protein